MKNNNRKVLILIIIIKGISGYFLKNSSDRIFSNDFLFGISTSAYQVEGAWNVSGKSPSNWDHFIHTWPNAVTDGSNADVACDSYHKIKDDIKLLKNLGVDFYKFSLAWARLIPDPFSNKVNPDGIRYYNELIDLLLENGIQPMVTIFHFDLPETLQKIGGFTNSLIIDYFVKYARVVFENFGDRVKVWVTLNEPHIYCMFGYGKAELVPAYNLSGVADYICSYNSIKAHAAVYHLYNATFRSKQNGIISINLDSAWFEPASSSKDDIEAAERAMQFELGLHAHPIFSKEGDYPSVVKEFIAKRSAEEGYEQSRLPQFTQEEIEYIRGTHDNVFCLIHYSTKMARSKISDPIGTPSFEKDINGDFYHDPSWPPTGFPAHRVTPWGFTNILTWVRDHYGDPIIYVTENGYAEITSGINDTERINFFKLYLNALLDAVYENGVQVKRYTAWSLLDNFEWTFGYSLKFGLHYVDFNDPNRTRKAKASAKYYKRVISTRKP